MNSPKDFFLKKIYFLFLFLFGCLLVFLIPPFQKNDEVSHYYRTIALKNGGFMCNDDGGFYIPEKSFLLPDKLAFGDVLFRKGKFPKSLIFEKSFVIDNNKKIKVDNVCNLTFLGYIPNLIGVYISDVFFENVLISFYVGRLFGLFLFLISLYLSISLVNKKYKYILYVYGLIPMLVHQVTAFSYDVLIFCLIPIIFSIFINDFLTVTSSKYNYKNFFIFLFLVFLLSIIKIVYIPLIFFYLVINLRHFFCIKKNKRKRIKYFLLCFFSYSIVVLLSVFISNLFVLKVETNYPNFVNPFLQKEILIHDPIYFFGLLLRTIYLNWEFYFRTFVGVYGWMDSPMNNTFIFYLYFMVFIFLIYWISIKSKKITWFELTLFLLPLLMVIFLIFLSMYLVYTPIAYNEILGVQGRYLLVMFPFLILFFGLFLRKLFFVLKNKKLYIFLIFAVFISCASFENIFIRYYDYSKNYEDSEVLQKILDSSSEEDEVGEVLIDGPVNFVIDTKIPDYKISSFQYFVNNKDEMVLIPYKFRIMDSHCINELKKGYLKQTDLYKKGIYSQFFGKLKVTDNKFCINLSPIFVPNSYKSGFLKIKTINGKPMINFLYLSK